jgi:hypothetical protein
VSQEPPEAIEYRAAHAAHAKAFAQFGWPSPELDAANKRYSEAAGKLRRVLGLEWKDPIPARYASDDR